MESRVIENYLKVVFNSGEWSDKPVTTGALATKLGLAPSSVSEAVRKLSDRGLLSHAPYGAITLTAQGQQLALTVIRKHRLIETFLVDYLGYGWDEVHDEAEVLEHAVSDLFVDRLDQKLGNPTVDPHGDPIPRSNGTLAELSLTPLGEIELGTRVRIERVHDDDPALLRKLDQYGITIGTEVVVAARHAADVVVALELGGAKATLPEPAPHAIRVTVV
ncbi:metal-dependent transcriptional regulator [Demequina aurantiaca]|uniref:metal-dependent transcriptional regulator n=1 Tax=Demequina aurantiaca TaxID=676200 RepID=UPI003D32D2C4